MYVSRDYSFKKMLDHRFTQYRCPSCLSYHVAVKSVVSWPDASAIVAIGEGEMECQDCEIVEKGKEFRLQTQSHSEGDTLFQIMKNVMHDTGDEWVDLLSKNYRRGLAD